MLTARMAWLMVAALHVVALALVVWIPDTVGVQTTYQEHRQRTVPNAGGRRPLILSADESALRSSALKRNKHRSRSGATSSHHSSSGEALVTWPGDYVWHFDHEASVEPPSMRAEYLPDAQVISVTESSGLVRPVIAKYSVTGSSHYGAMYPLSADAVNTGEGGTSYTWSSPPAAYPVALENASVQLDFAQHVADTHVDQFQQRRFCVEMMYRCAEGATGGLHVRMMDTEGRQRMHMLLHHYPSTGVRVHVGLDVGDEVIDDVYEVVDEATEAGEWRHVGLAVDRAGSVLIYHDGVKGSALEQTMADDTVATALQSGLASVLWQGEEGSGAELRDVVVHMATATEMRVIEARWGAGAAAHAADTVDGSVTVQRDYLDGVVEETIEREDVMKKNAVLSLLLLQGLAAGGFAYFSPSDSGKSEQ